MVGLRKKYPDNIFLMSGLHPCYVDSNYLEEISVVEDILNIDKSIDDAILEKIKDNMNKK